MTNPMMGPGGMGMGGPSGKWTSKRTGNTVIVRDTIIENDHMMVMLSTGQMIPMNEFSKEYIQISDEVYDQNGIQKGVANVQPVNEPDRPQLDENLLFKGMGDAPVDNSQTTSTPIFEAPLEQDPMLIGAPATTNKAEQMVNKVLDKVHQPTIDFKINWTGFPKDELNMLKNFFDVTNVDIAEAVLKRYVDINKLKDAMQTKIESLLEK